MGADDLATHDLPNSLGVIMPPLCCGIALRDGGGAPAAQHDTDVQQLAQHLALDDAKGRGSVAGYLSTKFEAKVAGHGQHAQCLGRTCYKCV